MFLKALAELAVAIDDGFAHKEHCGSLKIKNALAVAKNQVEASTENQEMLKVKTSLCSTPMVADVVAYLVHAYFVYLRLSFFCRQFLLNCQSCDYLVSL